MKCPVCDSRSIDAWARGFLVALAFGMLIGFIGGQMFYSWQYDKVFMDRLNNLVQENTDLRKGAKNEVSSKKN